MCVRFSMLSGVLWKLPLLPCLRCLCRTQWSPVLHPCDPLGTVPAPELSTREESSESVTHPQNLFLPPETIFSVKTWRTRRIQTHEGTEFEWEGEDRAEIELQQATEWQPSPAFPAMWLQQHLQFRAKNGTPHECDENEGFLVISRWTKKTYSL